MTAAPFHLAGERLMLDPGGCLNWPTQRMLVVADLHIGKDPTASQRSPDQHPLNSRDALTLLAAHIRTYAPRVVLCLGAPQFGVKGVSHVPATEHTKLTALAKAASFIWVLGPHDSDHAADLPGESVAEHRAGPLVFRHQAMPGRVAGEISGHFHPKTTQSLHGNIVTRPCFIADGYRLMMPSSSNTSQGLDVGDSAISVHFPRGGRVFLLGRERLYSAPIAPSRPGFAQKIPRPEPLLTRG